MALISVDRIKVLHAHNYYLQPGGEDTAFNAEVNLLRHHGHEVVEYVENNRNIASRNRADIALQSIWSWDTYRKMKTVLRQERPQIAHFHNTFPLISPSAYYACHEEKIPVIQSLDNPRLLCPSANFYREGHLCQDCLGKTPPWPGVIHRCYHQSPLQTAVVASMLSLHRWLKTWQSKIDVYLVATEFYRRKFVEGGLPAHKVVVKPHFIYPDSGMLTERQPGNYALFIGRLDPEKGVRTMLEAWKSLRHIPLILRGDGQLKKEANEFIHSNQLPSVELIQRLSREELTALIQRARFLIWPSNGYYETFGYVALECFANGVPVIASDIGVMNEIVTDGRTGLHFAPGDPADLAQKVYWAWEHPNEMAEIEKNARREYETKYTADRNYELLMNIYRRAIERPDTQIE
ncbi:MAG: glycosyltransferase family 4 protein [Chloroflexi bacterium]|nr:glycosyltransferase family 4 protein [Chloroflexota bacterium]